MLYKDSQRILSEREYYNFVLNEYQPTVYESCTSLAIFRQGILS